MGKRALGELPDDYYIDAGRDSDHGNWHALVVGPSGRFVGDAFGDDAEAVIREAVADALATTGRRAGGEAPE